MENSKLERRARFLENYLYRIGKVPPKSVAQPIAAAYARIVSFLAGDTDCQKPRGIFLYGPTGCGKTTLARALKECCAIHLSRQKKQSGFIFTRARKLCEDFTANDGFLPYLRETTKRKAVIIDDLGTEQNANRFGVSWGIADYIEDRWDSWEEAGFPTVFTSNFQTPNAILERYGERAMSRIVGMVDFINYNHPDRRMNRT